MTDPINFNIEELVARYDLHPDRRDVFVEGEQDQGLVRAFLENAQCPHVAVLSISVVNIPAGTVLARGLPHPNRRSEVITLALELEAEKVSPSQAVCIADADFEYLFPQGLSCALLLLTDYAAMELYVFSQDVVHTVLIIVAPKTRSSGGDVISDLSGPLQFLFSARATNVNLQMGLAWIEAIDKFFSVHNGRIQFDESEFLRRYLVDRVHKSLTDDFLSKLGEIRAQLTSDVRCRIHGHDFIKLLTWYLRSVEKCKHLNENSVCEMLYVAVRNDELA